MGLRVVRGLAAGGDADQVAKDAHGGHIGTGAGALDDERALGIAVGGEQDDVVGALDVEERMVGGNGGQAGGGLAGLGVKAAHVLEAFTLGVGFLPFLLHGLLDLGQAVHEGCRWSLPSGCRAGTPSLPHRTSPRCIRLRGRG